MSKIVDFELMYLKLLATYGFTRGSISLQKWKHKIFLKTAVF